MSANNGSTKSATQSAARSANELAHDALTLLQLQMRLLRVEAGDWLSSLTRPIILGIVAICVGLSCVPVALLFLAALLVEQGGLSYSASLAIATLFGLMATATLAGIAWLKLRRPADAFTNTRQELDKNVAWIKHVLKAKASGGSSEPATPHRQQWN